MLNRRRHLAQIVEHQRIQDREECRSDQLGYRSRRRIESRYDRSDSVDDQRLGRLHRKLQRITDRVDPAPAQRHVRDRHRHRHGVRRCRAGRRGHGAVPAEQQTALAAHATAAGRARRQGCLPTRPGVAAVARQQCRASAVTAGPARVGAVPAATAHAAAAEDQTAIAAGAALTAGSATGAPGSAVTTGAAGTPDREHSGVSALAARTAVTHRARRGTGTTLAAVAEEQAAPAAVAARTVVDADDSGTAIAAVTEQARGAAVTAVEPVPAVTPEEPGAATVARPAGARARVTGVAVAVAEQDARVRMVGGSIADEDADEVSDRVRRRGRYVRRSSRRIGRFARGHGRRRRRRACWARQFTPTDSQRRPRQRTTGRGVVGATAAEAVEQATAGARHRALRRCRDDRRAGLRSGHGIGVH